MNIKLVGLLGLLCSSAFATSLHAQEAGPSAEPQDTTVDALTVTGSPLREEIVAGKSDIPLLETPQAVSVVTALDIEARGVTRLSEALRTVAGVSRSTTYGFYDAYTIRGFDAAYGSVYLDGLINEAGVGFNQELSALEQIEVLKGPASMLFGQAPLGGLINLVSKRPRNAVFVNVSASTGSWNLYEGTLDANAPLNDSGTLLGRLNVVYRDSESFVLFAGMNRIFIAPSITWKPGPDTTLTFLARYQKDEDNAISPVPYFGTVDPGPFPIPHNFSVNNAGDQAAINNKDRIQYGYIFDHRFSDALSFSQTLRYTRREEYWDRWMFAAGFLTPAGGPSPVATDTIGRYYYGPFSALNKDFAVDSRFKGELATGDVAHEWLAGVDYRQNKGSDDGKGDFDPSRFPLSITNPDYFGVLATSFLAGTPTTSEAEQIGVYVQDHLKFGERFTITAGARYDWADASGRKDQALSPRIGATLQLSPGVNAYASWSRSFVPQLYGEQVIGLDSNGNYIGGPLPPEEGENIELGLKFAPESQPYSGSVAIFQLTRQNVATPDQSTDPLLYSVVSGEQQAKGFEAELHWQPSTALTVDLAYTYVDAKVTKDNMFVVGTPLANIPKHNLGAFAQYRIQDGALSGFGATLGVTYNSERNADHWVGAAYWLPAYTLVDAGVFYEGDGWGARLTVANLLDERYWPDTGGLDRTTPGAPRNWRLTLSKEF